MEQLSLLDDPPHQREELEWDYTEAHESDGTLVCTVVSEQIQGVEEVLVTGTYHGKKALACMRCAFPDC